mgnify:CR=1 FL=1|jgi:hypothetical protein
MTKAPCRDIKDFESFLLFIDNAYSCFAGGPAMETLPGHLLQPMHRNLVIIYDLLAARTLA